MKYSLISDSGRVHISFLFLHRRLMICILGCILFLGIVAGLGINYYKIAKARSYSVACISNLKLIAVASAGYKEKYGISPFVSANNIHDVMIQLVSTGFINHKVQENLKCGGINGYDYMIIDSLDKIQPKNSSMAKAILRDPVSNSHSAFGNINVLFEDGHIDSIPESKSFFIDDMQK